MTKSVTRTIRLGERDLEYRLIESRAAKHLRVRVTPDGVEVVKPAERPNAHVTRFLRERAEWIESQISRVETLGGLRIPRKETTGTILYRGERITFCTTIVPNGGVHRVVVTPHSITLHIGGMARTCPHVSLANWFRRQARSEIEKLLPELEQQLKRKPNRVYVMAQRTKWGNCSTLKNLSFNWRLILAPPFVLRYLVAHEMVHLAVPDHSTRFWLMLQSICPESERARQWLAAKGSGLFEEAKPAELESIARTPKVSHSQTGPQEYGCQNYPI